MVETLVGVEHEFRVLNAGGAQVNFRTLIHTLGLDGVRLDPGDTNAYRLRSGIAVTADEAEAEFATPPIPVRRGFAMRAAAWAARGRHAIQSALPLGLRLEGYSTHISVSVPAENAGEIAVRYARTFGVAFAALVENPSSLGVYVRPRPGRLELCGDFVDGPRPAAAVAFAAGSVRACVAAVCAERHAPDLPSALALNLLPGRERHGFRLHRHAAFGFDLYAAGREALLPLAAGGETTLQAMLDQSWRAARRAVGRDAQDARRLLDANIAGDEPLGIEGLMRPRLVWRPESPATAEPSHRSKMPPPFSPDRTIVLSGAPQTLDLAHDVHGAITLPRARPGFTLAADVATWDFTVFRAQGPQRPAFVCVPRRALPAFIAKLDAGRLDALVAEYLAAPATGRVLASAGQTAEPALYDAVADPIALLPPECAMGAPLVGRASKAAIATGNGARPSKATVARPGKLIVPFWPPSIPVAPRPPAAAQEAPAPAADVPKRGGVGPWLPFITVAAAMAGIVAIVAAVATSDDDHSGGDATRTATATQATKPSSAASEAVTAPAGASPTETPPPGISPSPTEGADATATSHVLPAGATPSPTSSPPAASTPPPDRRRPRPRAPISSPPRPAQPYHARNPRRAHPIELPATHCASILRYSSIAVMSASSVGSGRSCRTPFRRRAVGEMPSWAARSLRAWPASRRISQSGLRTRLPFWPLTSRPVFATMASSSTHSAHVEQ